MPIFIRLFVGIPLAAIVAVVLFLGMRLVVTNAEPALDKERHAASLIREGQTELTLLTIDFFGIDWGYRTLTRRFPLPETAHIQPAGKQGLPLASATPAMYSPRLPKLDFVLATWPGSSPIRVPPAYPAIAERRGLEGHCIMRFDVGPDGAPMNIRAASCTSSLFEQASIRAVERWRYDPKVVDGAAVMRTGLETRIDYTLAD